MRLVSFSVPLLQGIALGGMNKKYEMALQREGYITCVGSNLAAWYHATAWAHIMMQCVSRCPTASVSSQDIFSSLRLLFPDNLHNLPCDSDPGTLAPCPQLELCEALFKQHFYPSPRSPRPFNRRRAFSERDEWRITRSICHIDGDALVRSKQCIWQIQSIASAVVCNRRSVRRDGRNHDVWRWDR